MKKLMLFVLFFAILSLPSCGTIGGAISGMGADLDMVGGAVAGYWICKRGLGMLKTHEGYAYCAIPKVRNLS